MPPVYRPGEIIGEGRYKILGPPHRGSMALSYVARTPAGEKVFLKQFANPTPLSDWYRDYIDYQAELKRRVETTAFRTRCYRFVEFFEFAEKPGRPYYHQVFEYVPGDRNLKALFEQAEREPRLLSWTTRLTMAAVLAKGLEQMHAAGIIHSDLKPDNLLLAPQGPLSPATRYKLRIIDMDFSLLAERLPPPWFGRDDLGYFGTEGYMSPEHRQASGPHFPADVFSGGLILYELLTGQPHPYRAFSGEEYFQQISAYAAPLPALLGDMTPLTRKKVVQRVLHRCLAPEPGQRPTAAELRARWRATTRRGDWFSRAPAAQPWNSASARRWGGSCAAVSAATACSFPIPASSPSIAETRAGS